MGPHTFTEANQESGEAASMNNFAPTVYFKDELTGELKAYRMMVYIGHKTIVTLLFDHD